MPTAGVASHFVTILGADRAHAGRRAAVLGVVTVLLAIPAYFILPWQGLVVHVLAAVAGVILGNLWSRRRSQALERSLRGTWKAWMRWSVACESVADVHRRVTGKSGRNLPWWTAAGLTLLWALEVGLLALAFANAESAAWAIPVLAFNGLVAAFVLGHALHKRGWVAELSDSLQDMLKSGEIGVWGVL